MLTLARMLTQRNRGAALLQVEPVSDSSRQISALCSQHEVMLLASEHVPPSLASSKQTHLCAKHADRVSARWCRQCVGVQ